MSLVTYLFAFEGVKSFFVFRKTLCFLTSEFCKILKDAKEEEAKKCKEEGEERNEKIAMAAADFYDELIAYAEQEKSRNR